MDKPKCHTCNVKYVAPYSDLKKICANCDEEETKQVCAYSDTLCQIQEIYHCSFMCPGFEAKKGEPT